MEYPLMGNTSRSINSVRNLQRTFNKQYRASQLRDIWEQVFYARQPDVEIGL